MKRFSENSYGGLLLKNPLPFVFGSVFALFTCFGQTFLIALYNPSLRALYSLDKVELGSIYSLATFVSSLGLYFVGGLIDRHGEKWISVVTIVVLSLSYKFLTLGEDVYWLFLGLLLLRGSGQMTLGIIASTKIAKLFGRNRGKALSIIHLGRSVGEGIIPSILSYCILKYTFPVAINSLITLFLVFFLPFAFFICSRLPKEPLYPEKKVGSDSDAPEVVRIQEGKLKAIIQEKYALMVMILGCTIPFIVTGSFYIQEDSAAFLKVELHVLAQGFLYYSIGLISGNIFWGHVIDKLGPKIILKFSLLPILIGSVIFGFVGSIESYYVHLFFMSMSISMGSLARQSFYAQYYPHGFLGKIKGLDGSLLVFSTSVAPVVYSLLVQNKVSVDMIYLLNGIILFFGLIVYFLTFKGDYYD